MMKVLLENLYHSDFYLQPLRDGEQNLVGLELITQFTCANQTTQIPGEWVIARLSQAQQRQLLTEQLALLESCQHFFIQHKLFAWLNLTPPVATLLLMDKYFANELLRFPFIELVINENFPAINQGKENPDLAQLAQKFPLVLGNLGAGNSTMKAIFDGLFSRIRFDKDFIQQQITHSSFAPFMHALHVQITPCCPYLIAAGIDTPDMLTDIAPYRFNALHGALWPAVQVSNITTLLSR